MQLYELTGNRLQVSLNIGRGRKHKIAPLDLFLILLPYLKRSGTWEDAVSTFRLKKAYSENNITIITKDCVDKVYHILIWVQK